MPRKRTAMTTATPTSFAPRPISTFSARWRIWLIDGSLLGCFMISACLFGILMEHPVSPVRKAIDDGFFRRSLMGLAMGATAVVLIYSPWGRRSGAVLNPAVAASFWRLGKMGTLDALGYVAAQFSGATAGVALVATALPRLVGDPAVQFVRLGRRAARPGLKPVEQRRPRREPVARDPGGHPPIAQLGGHSHRARAHGRDPDGEVGDGGLPEP